MGVGVLINLTYYRKRALLAFPSAGVAHDRLWRLLAVPGGTGAVTYPIKRGRLWQPAAASGRDRESTHPIRKKATPNGVAFLRIRSLARACPALPGMTVGHRHV